MSIRNRVRLMAVGSVVILIIGGLGSLYSIRQITGLRDLQILTQETLATTYKLLVDTSSVSTTTGVLNERVKTWRQSLNRTAEGLSDIAGHRSLRLLDVAEGTESVQLGWRSAEDIFRQADEQLDVISNRGVPGIDVPVGLDHIAVYLESLSEETSGAPGTSRQAVLEEVPSIIPSLTDRDLPPEVYQEALVYIRSVRLRMNAATTNLNSFVTGSLQSLSDTIAVEAVEVVRSGTIITTAAVILLVGLALAGLLAGTRFLETANRTLEENVRERTRSIQSLLDFSDQGFLSFGPDMKVRPEYSRRCETIFGGSPLDKSLPSLFYTDIPEQEEFTDAMQLVFSGSTNPNVVFDLLDKEISLGDRTVEVEYSQISGDRIMCSLRDVTAQRALQARVDAENKLRAMLLTVVINHRDFAALIQEADCLFEVLERYIVHNDSEAVIQETQQAVHTFKANAGFLKLEGTTIAAHQLEQAITEASVFSDAATVSGKVEDLRGSYRADLAVVKEHLGSAWITRTDTVVVPREDLARLESHLRNAPGADPSFIEHLRMLRKVPFRNMEARFAEMASNLAADRGKRLAVPTFEGGDVLLDSDINEALSTALTHLVRNMVDHGIERPRERTEAGKTPEGHIHLTADTVDTANTADTAKTVDTANTAGGSLVITVEDDGRGIDVEAVRRRGIKQNLIDPDATLSREDLVRLIFHDGFSTAAVVSLTSGRGVGLPAVRRAVRDIGGKLTVTTRTGKGTRFVITVPMEAEKRMVG
ncbi:MAG: ATP-binding protein [Alkalispirochaeta sp.]